MTLRRLAKSAYEHVPFKLPLFRALRHLPMPERVYQHLHFDGSFQAYLSDGTAFRLQSHGDVVENRMFWEARRGGHERYSLLAWERLARAARGMALDIGANSGVFACVAKAANPALGVVAFEPVARVARRLRENVALNGYDIQVVEKAVSNQEGTATIHDSADPGSDTNAYSASLETAFDFNTVSYRVETMTLDGWRDRPAGPIDLIKLDVEKHEPAAVEGMAATIERDRPAMLVEVLDEDVGARLTALLSGRDYRFYGIDEGRGLLPLERLAPLGGENRNNLICTDEQWGAAKLVELLAQPSGVN